MKKVSVIVPCYNMEKYLDNCFKSLINQTYKNLEIIFVNDGSTDKTLDLLRKWRGEERLNFTLINQENKGLSATRNVGLRKATGDYIYFLDPDDIIFPTLIEELVNMLEDDKYDYSYCEYMRVKDGKKYEDFNFKNKKGKFTILNKTETLKRFLVHNLRWCVWNKLFKANIIKDNNIFFQEDCRYGEDTYFCFEYFKHMTKPGILTDKVLYYYTQRKSSLTHSAFNERRLDCYYSLNPIVNESSAMPEIVPYAHALRAMVACEMLYYIKKSNYSNGNVIAQIIEWQTQDAPYLKKCKYISNYMKNLIPLVPKIAKILLKKRLKNKSLALPKSMNDFN